MREYKAPLNRFFFFSMVTFKKLNLVMVFIYKIHFLGHHKFRMRTKNNQNLEDNENEILIKENVIAENVLLN